MSDNISELELMERTLVVLDRAGYEGVDELERMTDLEVLKIHGIGRVGLADLRKAIRNFHTAKIVASIDTAAPKAAASKLQAFGLSLIPTEVLIGELSNRLMALFRKQGS